MQSETCAEIQRLARDGESYAAFKSAAIASGLEPGEAERFYAALNQDGRVEADVRKSGMELRSEQGWLTSTLSVEVKR